MPLYSFFYSFFFPGEGGVGVSSGMSGSNLPQRHYCLGRMDICCLLSHVREWETSACDERREPSIWFHFLVLLKSVLIFHRQGFYCTDSIHKNSDWRSYFSSTNVRSRAERRREACASRRQRCGLEACPLVAVGTAELGADEAFHSHGAICVFLFFLFVTLETRHQRLDWPCRARRHYSGSIGRCKIHSKALP